MREGKTLNAVLEDAFMAGVRYGRAAFDRHDGTDSERTREAYLLWRDRWTGRPHEGPTGATEDPPVYTPGAPPGHYQIGHSEARRLGLLPREDKPAHPFDPGITGMSATCNELVIRDGDTTECGLPRKVHPS